jgi:ATP-dependent Clp protease protease subunit
MKYKFNKTEILDKRINVDDGEEDESVDDFEEEISEDEQSNVSVFDNFANVTINGPICPETIKPILDFIIGANLATDVNLEVINLFIDTEGGDLYSAMKLIDTMRMSEIPVRTIGWGKVCSAGLIIFMAGKERFLSENCSILSHNATFNAARYSVRLTDLSHQQEFKLIISRIMRLYKQCTGKDEKYIKKFLLRDNDVYLSADEAIVHNLAEGMLPEGIAWMKRMSNSVEPVVDPS